jgi:hypothetical protein
VVRGEPPDHVGARHVSYHFLQEMTKEGAGLRTGPKDSYHDKVFEEEINNLINITRERYELYAAFSFQVLTATADRRRLAQDILQGRHEIRLLRAAVCP